MAHECFHASANNLLRELKRKRKDAVNSLSALSNQKSEFAEGHRLYLTMLDKLISTAEIQIRTVVNEQKETAHA